jgi:hypothetical protein
VVLTADRGLAQGEPAPAAGAVAGPAAVAYPAAILPFEERGAGVKEMGAKVSDILFASLAANPALVLVDRGDLDRLLAESHLSLAGMASPETAVKTGELTGAKIIITGSVFETGGTLFLTVKVIGTETSRVIGDSVKGTLRDDLAGLAGQLAAKVAAIVTERGGDLVARPVRIEDRVAALKTKLGDAKRPALAVRIAERHVGQATMDPAAQTELILLAQQTGFTVLEAEGAGKAEVRIEGEGFSEFAMRLGNLVSVKARLEVKAVDAASGQVLAVDRATTVVVDLTEQIAGKAALQQAAVQVAERLLPRLLAK